MSAIGFAAVGGSIVSGIMGSNASSDAARAQERAAKESAQVQKYIYDQTRADQQPFREAGIGALGQMQDPSFQQKFSDTQFTADPGYQFRMAEGQKALERSAAARGNQMGGGQQKALAQYSQGLASQEYGSAFDRFQTEQGNRFNRLASLAGVGQSATNTVGAAGQNYAQGVSSAIMGGANAAAAGTIGQANAVSGAIGSGMNTWAQYQMNKNMFGEK